MKDFLNNLSCFFSFLMVITTSILGSLLSLYLLVDNMSLIYRLQIQGDLICKAIAVNMIFIVIGATIMQSAIKRIRK